MVLLPNRVLILNILKVRRPYNCFVSQTCSDGFHFQINISFTVTSVKTQKCSRTVTRASTLFHLTFKSQYNWIFLWWSKVIFTSFSCQYIVLFPLQCERDTHLIKYTVTKLIIKSVLIYIVYYCQPTKHAWAISHLCCMQVRNHTSEPVSEVRVKLPKHAICAKVSPTAWNIYEPRVWCIYARTQEVLHRCYLH